MNTNTLEKISKLKFYGMFRAFKTSMETDELSKYTTDELIADLVESEWEDRQNRSTERRLTGAHFCYKASVEEMYNHADRNLDRNYVGRLVERTLISRQENLLITGRTGIAKHL